MKRIYLLLSVIGALVPCFFFFQFVQLEGMNIPAMLTGPFANNIAGAFSSDILLSIFTFCIFVLHQAKDTNNPKSFIFVALALTLGLACALPAYLYAKEKIKTDNQAM
jgi:hypothetical protein